MPAGIRLQKLLSMAGVASRRAAEKLIVEGRVSVNGATVQELGTRADPDRDEIRVDGRRIRLSRARRYLLLNKPRGYVSTRSDPQGRPTVLDLIGRPQDFLYPVGRLDYDSEGLLLLTNDGELAARMTHPRYGLERAYEALVRGRVDPRVLQRLSRGVTIEGRTTAPARVEPLRLVRDRRGEHAALSITLREGRNRQVRRMCEAVGLAVERLRRVRLGPIHAPDLKPGQWRELRPRELAALKKAVGLRAERSLRAPR